MAQCGITGGIDLTCQQKQDSAGGLKQTAYIFNLNELNSLSYNGNNEVSSLNFAAYKGLYKFVSTKNGASTTSDITISDGGNASYNHTVVLSILDITANQKLVIEDLANSEVCAIVETSKGRFELFGYPLGLEIESAPKTSGNTPGDSTARVITLSGEQSALELVVSIPDSDSGNTSSDSTRAQLETYVV